MCRLIIDGTEDIAHDMQRGIGATTALFQDSDNHVLGSSAGA